MDYEELLTSLHKDLSKRLADAQVSGNMETVRACRLQMEQIEDEIKRILKMRGYKRS